MNKLTAKQSVFIQKRLSFESKNICIQKYIQIYTKIYKNIQKYMDSKGSQTQAHNTG